MWFAQDWESAWFAQDWESESSDPGVECYCYSAVGAEIESTLVVDLNFRR